MSLFILNSGAQPLGEFDLLDTDMAALKGGELMALDEASSTNTTDEKAAGDVFDGYIANEAGEGTGTRTRVVARIADIADGDGYETHHTFYLADDGIANYGVMFGEVIGIPTGLTASGTNLGPHTASGSGKVTLWDKPGMYAVSLDVIDADVVPTATFDTPLPGSTLYRKGGTGYLCRDSNSGDDVASFIELAGDGGLVKTPGKLVGASEAFDRIKINFFGARLTNYSWT